MSTARAIVDRVGPALVIGALAILALPSAALAQGASVSTSLSADTVDVETPFSYSVTITTQSNEEIRLSKRADFGKLEVRGQKQMPQFITINGVAERRVTLQYTLLARSTGTFTIGGAEFKLGRDRYVADDVTVKVVPRGKAPRNVQRSKDVFIDLHVEPNRPPYVGEQVTLQYDLMIDATQRDTAPKGIDEPSLDAFWIEDRSAQTAGAKEIVSIDGRLMQRQNLRTYAVFPLKAGPTKIEPMTAELQVGGFFRRGRSIEAASEAFELDVQPLPPDAPSSFEEGNVGKWELSVQPSTRSTRVGEPFTVNVIVRGTGQLARIRPPKIGKLAGARVADPRTDITPRERVRTVGGERIDRYDITPLEAGRIDIPALEFSFFDPQREEYVTRRSDPITIKVGAGEAPAAPLAEEKLARRSSTGGSDMVQNLRAELKGLRESPSTEAAGDPAHYGWWWWILGGGAFAGFVGLLALPFVRRWRASRAPLRRFHEAKKTARERIESAGGDSGDVVSVIRDFLHDVYGVPKGTVTANEVVRAFRRRDLPEEVGLRLAEVLAACESARYAPGGEVEPSVAREAAEALDAMPPPAINPGRAGTVAAVLLAGAMFSPAAEATQDPAALLAEHPMSVDVLYNVGTRAALDEDYATARWALERASWLDPSDADVTHNREIVSRIVRVNAIEDSRTGRTIEGDETLFWWRLVAHIPAWVFGLSMFVGWTLCFVLLTVRRRSDRPVVRDASFVGLVLIVLAASFLTFATVARASILRSTNPVVVFDPHIELREGPNEAAKMRRTPSSMVPGTLVRETGRRGEWVKLTWPGGTGWTTSASVRSVVGGP